MVPDVVPSLAVPLSVLLPESVTLPPAATSRLSSIVRALMSMAPEVPTFAPDALPVTCAIALSPDWTSTVPASVKVTLPWMEEAPPEAIPVRSCLTLPFLKVMALPAVPMLAVSVPVTCWRTLPSIVEAWMSPLVWTTSPLMVVTLTLPAFCTRVSVTVSVPIFCTLPPVWVSLPFTVTSPVPVRDSRSPASW